MGGGGDGEQVGEPTGARPYGVLAGLRTWRDTRRYCFLLMQLRERLLLAMYLSPSTQY
jgi:hypothetical protein